jgi:hypothetical protein
LCIFEQDMGPAHAALVFRVLKTYEICWSEPTARWDIKICATWNRTFKTLGSDFTVGYWLTYSRVSGDTRVVHESFGRLFSKIVPTVLVIWETFGVMLSADESMTQHQNGTLFSPASVFWGESLSYCQHAHQDWLPLNFLTSSRQYSHVKWRGFMRICVNDWILRWCCLAMMRRTKIVSWERWTSDPSIPRRGTPSRRAALNDPEAISNRHEMIDSHDCSKGII